MTHKLADDLGCLGAFFLIQILGAVRSRSSLSRNVKLKWRHKTDLSIQTRKREIENYLCADLIKEQSGAEVTFTDICDAKKIIGNAVGMKPDDVIDRFWPSMSATKIIEQSIYNDNGVEKSELVELTKKLTALVE